MKSTTKSNETGGEKWKDKEKEDFKSKSKIRIPTKLSEL